MQTKRSHEPQLLGRGVYSLSRAAQLAGVSNSSARRWVLGYSSAGHRQPGLIPSDLPAIGNYRAVSFLNLVELKLLAAFKQEGLSFQKVRRAVEYLQAMHEVAHPLAWNKLSTDGRDVFVWVEHGSGENVVIQTTGRKSGHCVMDKVVAPYFHDLDFSPETQLASRWFPAGRDKPIVVDPGIAFGEPVIEGTRIATGLLYDRVAAGDTVDVVAKWYALQPEEVEQARKFEASLRGAA